MGVEYRKDRGKWGYRLWEGQPPGKPLKRYAWNSEREAKRAYEEAVKQARESAAGVSLQQAAADYLTDSRRKRSRQRADGIQYNLDKWIIPFWGGEADIHSITPKSVEKFIEHHRGRQVKNITIWHYVKDLRALLNWCIKNERLEVNPVTKADLTLIRNRRSIKLPLNLPAINKGIESLKDRELLYANVLRYMGLRKDEGNHVQARDLLDHGSEMWLQIKYHQTDIKSNRVIPVPPVLWDSFRAYLAIAEPSDYILCNDPKVKVYDRRRMFENISIAAGMKVKPKDLRDYCASVLKADPVVTMQMLGHTNLQTTAIYTVQVQSRMLEAVQSLGAAASLPQPTGGGVGGESGSKSSQNDSETAGEEIPQPAKYVNYLVGA